MFIIRSAVVNVYEFRKGIYMVSVNDVRTRLFESLWDIPEGISYNAYIVVDDKVVLFDGVKQVLAEGFISSVKEVLGSRGLDYYVVHHCEPDHSGSFQHVVREFPNVKVLVSGVGLKILSNLYDVSFNYQVVSDDLRVSLGSRELRFIQVPWLHWPDTFATYLLNDKVLFSCDAFGSYGALTSGFWEGDYPNTYVSLSKRYFANIVSAYRQHVLKAIEKLSKYEVDVIAPAHGPLISDVGGAVERYVRWSKPVFDRKVVIIYSSMYGNLDEAVKYVARGVEEEGVKAVVMKVPETAATYVISELLDAPAIAIGVPTYDAHAFPYVEFIINLMRVKNFSERYVGIVSSGLWGQAAESKVVKMLEELKAHVEDRVGIVGRVKGDDAMKLVNMGRKLGRRAAQLTS